MVKAKMLFFIAILGMGMVGLAEHKGGGDKEHGFYWWHDNTVRILWDISTETTPSYLNYPEEIPWQVDEAIMSETYEFYPYSGAGIPFPFMFWWELRGYGDTTSSEAPRNYYVGVIVNSDGYIKRGVPLKYGGKYPPEVSGDGLWHNIAANAWFWFYGKVYKEIAISTDGWAAFNPGTVTENPHGNLPDPQLPNATIAPFWFDLGTEQNGYGANFWVDPAWWNPTPRPDTTYVHSDSGAVLCGFRWYMIDAYSPALEAADTSWPAMPHTNIGSAPKGHIYVPVPVFVIEWCDMQEADCSGHYTFEAQLINPVIGDTNWAKFVGRLGRPGIRKEIAEMEVAHMWFYQYKTLIPQQIICLYYGRYNRASGERPGDVVDWPYNHNGYDLVGVENEDGSKGVTSDYIQLCDLIYDFSPEEYYAHIHNDWKGKVKFDYFKLCYEDLGIIIVNPPFNTVLRYTHIRPVVVVSNYGTGSATEVPIDIVVEDTAGNQIYYDSRSINLYGFGPRERWRLPHFDNGTQDTFRFYKEWEPGEIGTRYRMRAEIRWGLDNCEKGNNIHEKNVYVHCDDTLKWHDGEPDVSWAWYSPYSYIDPSKAYTPNQDYETYIPWGGSQLKFSWVKGVGAWISEGFPDDTYRRFEMAMVKDEPVFGMGDGIFEPGQPANSGPDYNHLMYPPLRKEDSWDKDGWFDMSDLYYRSEGPPGRTILNNNISATKFNDTLWLGDSLAAGCWEGGTGDADGWVVYWTGQYKSEIDAGMGPFLIDALMFDTDGLRTPPLWDLTGVGDAIVFRCFNDKDYAPKYGIADANWFLPLPGYPESFHPMLEAYVHTAIYDAALYQIISPEPCVVGKEPGYYLEDYTSVDFKADIANLGREVLTDDNAHRFRVFGVLKDPEGNMVCSTETGLPKLEVGQYMKGGPPKWENSEEGGKEYDLLMCVKYEHPDMHKADHCPYNDSIIIPLEVLWTYDIACTEITSPALREIIPAGETMTVSAKFRNLGRNDTIDIPVTAKIYNAGDEEPPDSLIVQGSGRIDDLNWRCSPAGAPNEVEVRFGTMEIPPTTIPDNPLSGRFMKVECRLAAVWMDEDPENDSQVVYVNVPPGGIAEEFTNFPKVFKLYNILPNPIISSVTIKYDVPFESMVSLKVYDATGKLIKTLVDGRVNAGYKEVRWDGFDNNGKKVSRGIYFVRMDAPKYKATKKLVIVH